MIFKTSKKDHNNIKNLKSKEYSSDEKGINKYFDRVPKLNLNSLLDKFEYSKSSSNNKLNLNQHEIKNEKNNHKNNIQNDNLKI